MRCARTCSPQSRSRSPPLPPRGRLSGCWLRGPLSDLVELVLNPLVAVAQQEHVTEPGPELRLRRESDHLLRLPDAAERARPADVGRHYQAAAKRNRQDAGGGIGLDLALGPLTELLGEAVIPDRGVDA